MAKPAFVAGGTTYSPQDDRLYTSVWKFMGQSNRLGARSGLRPGGTPPVTISGMQVTVGDIVGTIFTALSSTIGSYDFAIPGNKLHTVNAADGTNPRKDIIYARVRDTDFDSSGFRDVDTYYLAGTPAASPIVPTVPPLTISHRIATITVPAGSTTPTLVYDPDFVVALGGILPVQDMTQVPPGGLYEGMFVYDMATDRLMGYDGAAWWEAARKPVTITTAPTAATGFSTATLNATIYGGPKVKGSGTLQKTGSDLNPNSSGNITPDTAMLTLPSTVWPASTEYNVPISNGLGHGEASVSTAGVMTLRCWTTGGGVTVGDTIRYKVDWRMAPIP